MATGQVPSFAALLRRYRRAAGLTQEALAEQAHLSVYTVSALERGANQTPRKDTVALLAETLELAPRERAALEAAARGLGTATDAPPSATARTSIPFVGRAQELALLDCHLAGEGPPVLLLAGEPGIGKSRLLREAHARAHSGGWTILAGGCQRGGGQDPYAPLPAALEQRLRRATAAQARTELEGCAWLARLLPEVAALGAEALPPWTLTPAQERRLVVRAVERYLRNVAGPAGTLLVLDDVQWAGPDGLEMLATLVQTAEEIPLRVIAAYRSTEVRPGASLSTVVADLLSARQATQRPLELLAPEEAATLLDQLLAGRPASAEERAQVLRRAGRLPFFLVSCVEGLAAGGQAADVPETVAQSIRQRVAALAPAAQEVLRAAAVVGRVADRAVLVAMSVQPRAEVLESLESACRAHLLEEEGSTAYRFAHDLVREVVEGDLSAARRAALHQRAAEALEGLPGTPSVEVLAYHYGRSDAVEKAVLYLERAGDHAMATGANSAAEGYYRDLVRRLEALGRRADGARAYAKLGLLLQHTARINDALSALRLCFDRYAATTAGPAREDLATADAGYASAGAASQEILALIDEREPEHARGALYLAYATFLAYQEHYQDCLAVTERAAELAGRRGDMSVLAQLLILRGQTFRDLGRPREGLDALHAARRLCEANGLMGLLVMVLLDLALAHGLGADVDQVRLYSARCLEIAEQLGDTFSAAMAVRGRRWYAYYTGDWAAAQVDLTRCIQMAPHLAHDESVLAWQGELFLRQGAWTEAAAFLQEALDLAARTGKAWDQVWPQRLLAELDLLQERPAAALARLQPLLGREEVHDVAFMLPLVAWAQLQLGHLDEATATARQAIARATTEANYRAWPEALRVQALVATEQQQWVEAERALDEGLALTRRIRYPYAEARLLHAYGHTHSRKGEPALARGRLEEALDIFRRLGARKDIERAEQQLADLAQSPAESLLIPPLGAASPRPDRP